MHNKGLATVIILTAIGLTALFAYEPSKSATGIIPLRVAHAGGGIEEKTYTNSYEALDINYAQGFRYFELDFVFTSDEKLICLHDWRGNFQSIFGFKASKRSSLKEFKQLIKSKAKYTNCTLDGLADWMKSHPDAKIVTDVKERNLIALETMYATLPNAKSRVIPQLYQPENYEHLKNMGYENIIWTLYRYNGNNDSVMKWAEKFKGAIAITMPLTRASTNLATRLAGKNIPTYVHTINSETDMKKYQTKHNITEIYTDFLVPKPNF